MRHIHITVRTAVEGLKAEIVASPSIWAELAEHGGDDQFDGLEDVAIVLDVPRVGPSDDGKIHYRIADLVTRAGAEQVDHDPPAGVRRRRRRAGNTRQLAARAGDGVEAVGAGDGGGGQPGPVGPDVGGR